MQLKNNQIRQKRRTIFYRKLFFIFISLLIIVAGLSFLSRYEKLTVQNVQIHGNKIIDTALLEDLARKDLAGNKLFLFARRNSFIYPKEKIKKDLLDNFKRISKVDLKILDLNTLDISLVEREGKYLWCKEIDANSKEPKCYFLDDAGYIFDEAPFFSGSAYFKFYGPESIKQMNDPISQNLLPADEFLRLISFYEAISKSEVLPKPIALLIRENNEYEFIFAGEDEVMAPKIIFKKENNFEKIFANLNSAILTDPLKSQLKNISNLEYIDLRFNDKVYFKFK